MVFRLTTCRELVTRGASDRGSRPGFFIYVLHSLQEAWSPGQIKLGWYLYSIDIQPLRCSTDYRSPFSPCPILCQPKPWRRLAPCLFLLSFIFYLLSFVFCLLSFVFCLLSFIFSLPPEKSFGGLRYQNTISFWTCLSFLLRGTKTLLPV